MHTGFAVLLLAALHGPQGVSSSDLDWPREVIHDAHTVVAYQPQVDSWEDYATLRGRMAVEVRRDGQTEGHFGAVHLRASTLTDFSARVVHVRDIEVEKVVYPAAGEVDVATAERVVRSVFGQNSITLRIEGVLSGLVRGYRAQHEVQVNDAAPPVFYSAQPAVLVQFLGRPQFAPIPGTGLRFAWNTNWDVLFDTETSRYFVLVGDAWLTRIGSVKGPWSLATELPPGFSKLPDNLDWARARAHVPGRRTGAIPSVLVSERPAELIVTEGSPELKPIDYTGLNYVANTASDLFWVNAASWRGYYYLVAGRWFRAKSLAGPWQAATDDLPSGFAAIPPGHEKGRVLASVPGTRQARESVIRASIPRQVRMMRGAKVSVIYDGKPKFDAVPGTSVSCAVNTRHDVFRITGDDQAYLCFKGAWFVGEAATGPWTVCDSPPVALYSIPPAHPKHHVTYVFAYDSTPDWVVVGYTAGYKGMFVSHGVPVFGTGYWVRPALPAAQQRWWSYWPSYYWGYGGGAFYSSHDGAFFRSSIGYGPHGGAGRAAIYDPQWRSWVRGDNAHGPAGSGLAGLGHSPWSGGYGGALARPQGYASWGSSIAATERDGARKDDAAANKEASAPVAQTTPRPGFAATKNKLNNVFVGEDGGLYKSVPRTPSGWMKWDEGQWRAVEVAQAARPSARSVANASAVKRAQYWQQLGRAQYARERAAQFGGFNPGPRRNDSRLPNYIGHIGWW